MNGLQPPHGVILSQLPLIPERFGRDYPSSRGRGLESAGAEGLPERPTTAIGWTEALVVRWVVLCGLIPLGLLIVLLAQPSKGVSLLVVLAAMSPATGVWLLRHDRERRHTQPLSGSEMSPLRAAISGHGLPGAASDSIRAPAGWIGSGSSGRRPRSAGPSQG